MLRRAVIVGVDGKEAGWDFVPLKYAVNDAIRVHNLFERLKEVISFEELVLLRNPSDHEVRCAVQKAVKGDGPGRPPLGKGDLFIFYFAGHGKKQTGGKYLLLCPEASKSVFDAEDTNGTVTDTFLSSVAGQGPHDCLFIFDACRSVLLPGDLETRDGATCNLMDGEANMRNLVKYKTRDISRTCITLYSCHDKGQALELATLKGGLFTSALDECMRSQFRDTSEVCIDTSFVAQITEKMLELSGGVSKQTPGMSFDGGTLIQLGKREFGRPLETRKAPPPIQPPPKHAPFGDLPPRKERVISRLRFVMFGVAFVLLTVVVLGGFALHSFEAFSSVPFGPIPPQMEKGSLSVRLGFYMDDDTFLEEGAVIRTGDLFHMTYQADSETFLYIVNLDPAGKSIPMFPLEGRSVRDPVPAKTTIRLPADDRNYEMLEGAVGMERIVVVASEKPLPELEGWFEGPTGRQLDGSVARFRQALDAGLVRFDEPLDGTPSRSTTPAGREVFLLRGDGMVLYTFSFEHL